MSFTSITNILSKNINQKSGLKKQIIAALVCDEFDKIIIEIWGEKIRDQVRAIYYKNNILTIASLSSVVAQEIKLNEQNILEKLNKKFDKIVEQIRYLT